MSSPIQTRPKSMSTSSAGSTGSEVGYDNASMFKSSPFYKTDQLDDLSHGATAKARRWSGGKKRLGEGRSHFENRLPLDYNQRAQDPKLAVKKNKELPTRVKKNHTPEQAAKVLETDSKHHHHH